MKNTRILIVGQGLAGSLLAFQLWKRKVDFLVMDMPDPSAASQVAGGAYIPLVFRSLKKVKMIDEYLAAMFEAYGAMEKLLGQQFLYTIPSLKIFHPNERERWEEAHDSKAHSFIQRIVPSLDIAGVKPGFSAAVIEPSGYVDIQAFTMEMGRWLAGQGLLVREKLDYDRLDIQGDNVVVNETVKAGKLVFCEGAAGGRNPWFGWAGFSPNKGEILQIHSPRLSQDFILRGDVFVLPLGQHQFRVGATYGHQSMDNHPSKEAREQLLRKMEAFVDAPYEVVAQLAGVRPGVKDRHPLLGAHPEFPRLFIFNGMGSRGVLYTPFWSAALSKWLIDEQKDIPPQFLVNRYYNPAKGTKSDV